MATINDVLAQVDELKPNAYSEEVKAGWLLELEGRLAVEVLEGVPPTSDASYDAPLLVPPPYDNLYVLYAGAMVDYWNQEFDNYANGMVMFNQALEEYRKWYQRAHRPERAGTFQNVV